MRTVSAVALLALAACSPGASENIDGTWKGIDEPNEITFGPGGDFKQTSYSTTYTGKWKSLGSGQVEVEFTGQSVRLGKIVLQTRFDKGILYTTNPAGRQQQWKR
jgi:hypothetical protein